MKQHVAKTAAACFYHLRRLRQIRRHVGEEVTTRLVIALVISRLDYCNSLLAGLPRCTIEPLQRVQNIAARLIFKLSASEHIKPSLLQLHWVPIRWRVQFKLLLYARSCHRTLSSVSGEHRATSYTVTFRSATGDRHLPTSLYRGQETSSVSLPSVMPTRLRGTHCRAISAKQSTLLVLDSC